MITVLGSSNVDVVLRVKKFTQPGETQKALEMRIFPGGKGANQAVTVAKLQEKCTFLTRLSNDEGKILIDTFKRLNIEGWELVKTPTGKAFIEVTEDGENRIIIFAGANATIDSDFVLKNEDKIKNSEFLLLQNEIPMEANLIATKMANKNNVTVILDPAPAEEIDLEILKKVDIITPNENELRTLAENLNVKSEDIDEIIEAMLKLGIKSILVKLGEKGSIFANNKRKIHVKAFDIKNVVDTTAAGDVYNGAFAVALRKEKNIEYAMKFASAAAGISITRKGAQSSIPDLQEVLDFLDYVSSD